MYHFGIFLIIGEQVKKKNAHVHLCVNICDSFTVKIFTHTVTLITFPLFIKLNREGIIEEKGSEQCFVEWE